MTARSAPPFKPMSSDLLEVPAELNEALTLLRDNRTRLEATMAKTNGFNRAHSDAAGKLAAAVKALSTEARLWANELTERASKASPEQRTAAALQHLLQLPQGPRAEAYAALVDREKQNPQKLALAMWVKGK